MKKVAPFAADLALVILFCAIGRRSHDEAVLTGLAKTAWPFATGLLLGWAVAYALHRGRSADVAFDGRALWPTGVVIWALTLIGGMLLRVVASQGTAVSFVIVAATVLALFLLGWRAAVAALPRSLSR
ncbi:DUF3054 domain-containing protein [Nocardia takedensis]|uniref:DUF3054 domain-containing protein n=1 Tax=Nocardia takedensis TaxID=259390 RepID=UPI0002E6128C|nr:DUF3054 domain-containing protein [Nocardia takedensis]